MPEFRDGKQAGALRTIGEVSMALGIKPHVLRYWENQFPQLTPLKRAGGRRLYRPQDVAVIERIDRLIRGEGYTLKGARAALEGGEPVRLKPDAARSPSRPADLLARLKAIRSGLAAALAA